MIRSRFVQALLRSRGPILGIALTYVLSVTAGVLLVHSGNEFSLRYRDRLVAAAKRSDPASRALAHGAPFRAALFDFGRNLVLGAIPTTVGGLAIVVPYLTAAYRGWVGGIVSVDRSHASRLADPHERFYYLLTLVLQLVPYSLAGGAGVRLGLVYLSRGKYPEPRLLGVPRSALLDVLWIYSVIVPLFFIASLWEFLAR